MTPEEVELLSELTIVIPTYNRPLELERAIEYWRDIPVTVHILDGSDKPWFPLGATLNVNTIRYHHVAQSAGETSRENFVRRLRLSAELVKTKYSAFCSDDDIQISRGLVNALQALKNDESDVVIGKCAQYLFREGSIEWKRINWDWRSDALSVSRDIWDHFASNSKGSTYYGVYKTSEWKKIRLSSIEHNFSHDGAIENISDFLTKHLLRVLVLESYLWITNYPDLRYPNVESRLNYRFTYKNQKFSSWLNADDNKDERDLLKKVLQNGFKKFRPESEWHLAIFFGRTFLLHKPQPVMASTWSRIQVLTNARILFLISNCPKVIRKTLFNCLPKKFKEILRTDDFVDSRTPVMDIDSDDPELIEAIRNWERILLMPREDLRLRANV